MNNCKAGLFKVSTPVILFALTSAVLGAAPSPEQRTEVQIERLKDIEDVANLDRANTENQYRVQSNTLIAQRRRSVERLVHSFPLIERILWIELIRAHQGRENLAGGLVDLPTPGVWNENMRIQRETAESYSFTTLTEILLEADALRALMEIRANAYHPRSLWRTAEKMIRQIRPSTQGKIHLDLAKEARLKLVDQWEAYRMECVLSLGGQTSGGDSSADASDTSLMAIVRNATTGYGCFVRGSDDLLHSGDRVGDVAIVNIGETQVTFARNGDRWTDSIED